MASINRANRVGFWILFGTSLFQIGCPIVYSVTFRPSREVTYAALFFVLFSTLSFCGFAAARVINALFSAVLCALLGMGLLAAFRSAPPDDNAVRFILFVLGLPAVGYGACTVLLFLPVVSDWQRQRRQVIKKRMDAGRPEEKPVVAESEDLQPCPWCGARVLLPSSEECSACRRLT